MTVLIGNWEFEGPFVQANDFRQEAGVYAILENKLGNDDENHNGDFELITINQSDNVKKALENFKNNNRSFADKNNNYSAAVYYCSDLTVALREGLIEELQKEFDGEDDATWFHDSFLTPELCSLRLSEFESRNSA